MENATIEFPEVVGKSIAELSVYDDAMFGCEILVRSLTGLNCLSLSDLNSRWMPDIAWRRARTPRSSCGKIRPVRAASRKLICLTYLLLRNGLTVFPSGPLYSPHKFPEGILGY
jgi:hypothetical protein